MNAPQFPGSRWWKFDFHTHTPASSDYEPTDKHITPRDWLLAHMQKGVDAVVVTDHNSADWIDTLQKELQQLEADRPQGWRELVLFPGVEITTSERVHLLGVFAPSTPAREIWGLLHGSDVAWDKNSNAGNADWRMSNVNLLEMMQRIKAKGGLAIPAHVDKHNGLLASQSGSAYQAEVPRSAMIEEVLGLADALDVRDPSDAVLEHFSEQIKNKAQVDGADAPHSLANVGTRWVWLKMTQPTLEGVMLALAEPQLSVQRSSAPPEHEPKQWIESLEISDLKKRWQKLRIEFNPWLNTVIGGRGSGKSSVVECLRLALGRGNEVAKQLGDGHEVTKSVASFSIEMVSEKTSLKVTACGAGELKGRYRYGWAKQADQQAVMRPGPSGLEEWVKTEIQHHDVVKDFPVRLFSQKQIHALANQPGGLLGYIDSSRTNNLYLQIAQLKKHFNAAPASVQNDRLANSGDGSFAIVTRESAVNRFESARARVRALQSELSAWPQVKDQLAQVNESLAAYAKQGIHNKLQTLQRVRAEKRAMQDFQGGIKSDVDELMIALATTQLNDWQINLPSKPSAEALALADSWEKSFAAIKAAWQSIDSQVSALRMQVDALKSDATFEAWNAKTQAEETDCLYALEAVKTQLGGQLQQVGVLQQTKEELEKKNAWFEVKAQELLRAKELVSQRYAEMVSAREAITAARQAFVDQINKNASEETLKITLHCAAHYDQKCMDKLRQLLGLNSAEYANTFLGDLDSEESKGIVATLKRQPEQLEAFKKAVEELATSADTNIRTVLEADLGGERSYIRNALKNINPRKLDELWTWFPEDKVQIQFRQNKTDKWQDISEGSAGQKTGAMLSFILNEGEEPLILDQPEDDLDNENVSKLVVEQLRQSKSRRQVIVVTHNANIVVNGDAELVIPMAFRGGQIQRDAVGGLQDASVRAKICEVMEGGEKAFRNRYDRVLKGLTPKV